MSRVGDDWDYEENFPNEWAFWENRAKQARTSKRGRKALAELREALLALPQKRLIEGALSTVNVLNRCDPRWQRPNVEEKIARDGEGVCAVGAYMWFQQVKAGLSHEEAFAALPLITDDDGGIDETASAGVKAGLTYTLASVLATRNDDTYSDMTPEERYEKFMAWLDKQLEDVPA